MKIGVMAITVLKNLVKGPDTIRYPSQPAKMTEATRGHLVNHIEDCTFCSLCQMHCPADAIKVSRPDRTWTLNQFQCVICGCCVSYCPKDCLLIEQTYLPPTTEEITVTLKGPDEEKPEEQGSGGTRG